MKLTDSVDICSLVFFSAFSLVSTLPTDQKQIILGPSSSSSSDSSSFTVQVNHDKHLSEYYLDHFPLSFDEDTYEYQYLDNGLEVITEQGQIRGIVPKSPNMDRIRQFLGIPYARPPVGKLRFENPQPALPWSPKILNAKREGPACLQPIPFIQSEDCLYLNVYAPSKDRLEQFRGKLLPVMLWIHGGGWQLGSGTAIGIQDPSYIVQHRDVIVVTINYRLGALGFLVADGDIDGNFGLFDQRLAMDWVHDNIANFGGDPSRVTLWGESAGAMSIGFHMTSPAVPDNMFRGAIMESNVLGYHYKTIEESKSQGYKLCKYVGCSKCDKSCLKSKPALAISHLRFPLLPDNQRQFLAEILTWSPVIDGVYITGQPVDLMDSGKGKKIPVLMGYNSGEAGLAQAFLDIIFGFPLGRPQPLVTRKVYSWLVDKVFPGASSEVLNLYPASNDPERNVENIIDIVGDFLGVCPGIKAARILAEDASAHFYMFNFTASLLPSWLLKRCRDNHVCHAMELPYVFHSLQNWPIVSKFSKEEHTISHSLIDYFVQFSYGNELSGRDGTDDEKGHGNADDGGFWFKHDNGRDEGISYQIPAWPPLTSNTSNRKPEEKFSFLHFGRDGKAQVSYENYRDKYCKFWNNFEFKRAVIPKTLR